MIQAISNLIIALFGLSRPFKPTIRAEITITDLYKLLRDAFPEASIYLSDKVYNLCNLEDIEEFLKQDKTNHSKYVPEDYDCDDFSYRLMGQFSIPGWSSLAFGIFWSDVHALNAFIDQNLDFWYIEPQSDGVSNKLADWQGSTCRVIMM